MFKQKLTHDSFEITFEEDPSIKIRDIGTYINDLYIPNVRKITWNYKFITIRKLKEILEVNLLEVLVLNVREIIGECKEIIETPNSLNEIHLNSGLVDIMYVRDNTKLHIMDLIEA